MKNIIIFLMIITLFLAFGQFGCENRTPPHPHGSITPTGSGRSTPTLRPTGSGRTPTPTSTPSPSPIIYDYYLYVVTTGVGPSNGYVSSYKITYSDGTLGINGTKQTGSEPHSLAIDPTGEYLYVANTNTSNNPAGEYNISAFTIDSTNGQLYDNGTCTAGTNPFSIVIENTGSALYTTNIGNGSISAFRILQEPGIYGKLYHINPDLLLTSDNPGWIVADSDGYTYVVNLGTLNITSFQISESGSLSSTGNQISIGSTPTNAVLVENILYVSTAGAILVYSVDYGTITYHTTITGLSNPAFTVVHSPTCDFLYIAESTKILTYKLDFSTWTPNYKSTLNFTLNIPKGMAVDPDGRYLYVSNHGGSSISIFTIDASHALSYKTDRTTGGLKPDGIAIIKFAK